MTRRRAARVYRWALRAFSPAHRAAYGAEMIDAFERELAARRQAGGRIAAARLVFAASLDAIAAGLGERRRPRQARAARAGQAGPKSRLWASWLDVKLGLRMLVRFPGLSIAGGLALALAIGAGAAWYDVARDQLRPSIPLPEGDRLVEIAMRDAASSRGEWRTLHDFMTWRRDAQAFEALGAYQTLERNLIAGDAPPEIGRVAAISASGFAIARVPPLIGRTLLESDERPGAPPVVVIGHAVWHRTFGRDPGVLGRAVRLGRDSLTVVGVMPEGFRFPVSHDFWIPFPLEPSGYAPLEGPAVQVFARLAPGVMIDRAQSEVTALVARTASSSPDTHRHLRPFVFPYGADELAVGSWLDHALTHLPVLLVLVVACANVATLIYARTATREAEIAVRYALGAGRARIVGQLFVEALVLALVASAAGLALADTAVRRTFAYVARDGSGVPFWLQPGLDPWTTIYAASLAVAAAAMLAVIPALKATGSRVQPQLRNLGAGGSTLRFGRGWTTAMVAQVALTVVCLPPAIDLAHEAVRDRTVRSRALTDDYLAVLVELDREVDSIRISDQSREAFGRRRELVYRELERRVAEEAGVRAVTFGDALPGMAPAIRSAELEAGPGADPIRVQTLWTAAVGDGYFAAFDKAVRAGRGFLSGDRTPIVRTAIVNEAFARRLGASPVGRRIRFTASASASPDPWREIVGVVEDVGMTPTNRGEAPYLYLPASPETSSPLVMAVRTAGDPQAFSPRVRALAAAVDPGLRLELVQPLDDIVWEQDVLMLGASAGIAGVVALGVFLSAAGVFALMSVTVSRRTREIGLRTALGASRGRLLTGVFSRALVLIGSGLVAGNVVILLLGLEDIAESLILTSMVMLAAGVLACIQPARRALRVDPADALRQT